MVDGNALNTGAGTQDFDVPADDIPPFIPVNAPGIPGAGICYGGVPTGNQTITQAGNGYVVGDVYQTRIINNDEGGTTYTGTGLQFTATADLNTSDGTATIAPTGGTGYITGQVVEVLNTIPGARNAQVTIVGAGTLNELITENKEQQRAQCERMMPFNATEGISYGEVVNGSNVVGIADLTITAVTAADGTATAAGANQGRQFWNDQQAIILAANIVDSPAGNGLAANRTITWNATGASVVAAGGAAVPGQALQRSFTTGDVAANTFENLVVTCTVLYTDAAGASATESFLISGQ